MKQIILTLAVLLTFCLSISAQNVPQGMKYQAVARDASGQVLSNQKINLKITLYSESDKTVQYSEVHTNTTNQLGLFSLEIGNGTVEKGSFAEVPWSTGNIWMSISIDEKGGDDFITISDSELLTVPYAFHAMTADQLTGTEAGTKNLDPYKIWLLGGNVLPAPIPTDLVTDNTFGTLNDQDLVFIANSNPAMVINHVDGSVNSLNDHNVEGNLTVNGFTELNDLSVTNNLDVGNKTTTRFLDVQGDVNLNIGSGTTNINGPTTIRNTLDVDESTHLNREGGSTLVDGPTTIRNTLDVDESTHLNREGGSTLVDGPTTIRNTLDVDESTHLNREGGSTLVDGPTTIRNTLDVDESTHLNREGGSTLVDGPTTIRNTLDVDESTHLNREGGSTLVDGPTTIRNTLDVDESTHLNREGGSTLVDGPTTIRNTLDVDESTHLNREGGSTLVDGPTTIRNTLDVDESTHLNREGGTTTIDGVTTITNITESTAPTNGALNVDGGVGIEKNLNVAGDTKIDGTLLVRTNGSQGAFGGHVAQFENLEDGNGICIKVGSPQPQNPNNFITFKNRAGGTVGRVEGESTAGDLANNLEYQDELDFYDIDIENAGKEIEMAENSHAITIAELTIASVEAGITITEQAIEAIDAAAAASTIFQVPCGFPGPCVTPPSPIWTSLEVAGTATLIAANISATAGNVVTAGINVDLASDNVSLANEVRNDIQLQKQTFINTHQLLIGVTYASGAGDYAEYLPKLNPDMDIKPGEVVGMKNGIISRNTQDADRVMVISYKPAVLGNMPEQGMEDQFEKVAFMGQVLTKSFGKVSKGDYMLSSGLHNGYAVAKSPEKMELTDYKRIVGVAWSDCDVDGSGFVKVAVGLNTNDLSSVIRQQQEELKALESKISKTNNVLANLIPGFREALDMPESIQGIAVTQPEVIESVITKTDQEIIEEKLKEIELKMPTREVFDQGFDIARRAFANRGVDLSTHPFWSKVDNDPSYKEELILNLENHIRQSLEMQKELVKNGK